MIQAQFSQEKITSVSEDAFMLFDKSKFGEKISERIEYSLVEALFLLNEKKLTLFTGSKPLTKDQSLKKARSIDKRVETKLVAFTDLRKKGYIVKTALKFGADFRIYDKGVSPGEDHAKWILFVTKQSEHLQWQDFAAKNRVAHSTKKNLLIAIVDEESDVSYYEISWIKP
jgi:tRNA-intron endonuclease, archaea type